MPDCFSTEKRSQVMANIKSTGTQPEKRLGALLALWLPNEEILHAPNDMVGRPDFVLPSLRIAIFLDGCFFHGCPLHYREPKQNSEYWIAKVARNKLHDKAVTKELKAKGWRVIRIWEHELRTAKMKGRERIRRRIRYALAASSSSSIQLIAAEQREEYILS